MQNMFETYYKFLPKKIKYYSIFFMAESGMFLTMTPFGQNIMMALPTMACYEIVFWFFLKVGQLLESA